jgi:hypothetical protein
LIDEALFSTETVERVDEVSHPWRGWVGDGV